MEVEQSTQQKLDSSKREHDREQTSRTIMMWGIWSLMVALFIIAVSAVVTLGWHTLTPESCHWLNDEQLQDIKDFVLSGAVVGLSTSFLRRYLEPLKQT